MTLRGVAVQSRALRNSGVRLSRIGFGCVSLTTHARVQDALRLLHEALGAGITHFDVARLYGLGRAEGILGRFARAVARDRITIATKFGLDPPRIMGNRPALIRLGKKVLRYVPALRTAVNRRLQVAGAPSRFSPESAARSLETSLRELGTEYVDLLLLHEAEIADACSAELLEYLEGEVRAGRVRAFGVASSTTRLKGDPSVCPANHAVLQFDHSALSASDVEAAAASSDRLLITHSALAPLDGLRRHMVGQEELVRRWSAQVEADLADPRVLAELLLDYALQANRDGVVLFGTMRSDHLQANVRCALDNRRAPRQMELFRGFCRMITSNSPA
jgi:D-threo-aldose 1-dehydrogenase